MRDLTIVANVLTKGVAITETEEWIANFKDLLNEKLVMLIHDDKDYHICKDANNQTVVCMKNQEDDSFNVKITLTGLDAFASFVILYINPTGKKTFPKIANEAGILEFQLVLEPKDTAFICEA